MFADCTSNTADKSAIGNSVGDHDCDRYIDEPVSLSCLDQLLKELNRTQSPFGLNLAQVHTIQVNLSVLV